MCLCPVRFGSVGVCARGLARPPDELSLLRVIGRGNIANECLIQFITNLGHGGCGGCVVCTYSYMDTFYMRCVAVCVANCRTIVKRTISSFDWLMFITHRLARFRNLCFVLSMQASTSVGRCEQATDLAFPRKNF